MRSRGATIALTALAAATLALPLSAQMEETAPRGPDEGGGPYERLIIRGVTMIDGTGAPPQGPMDIVIEGDRIAEIRSVGYPGVPLTERGRRSGGPGAMSTCNTEDGGRTQGSGALGGT